GLAERRHLADVREGQGRQAHAVLVVVVLQPLVLELGHVDLAGALGLARLALEAEVEDLVDGAAGEAAGQPARDRLPEYVRAAAGGVVLVARGHVAGAHGADAGLAAGADAGARLDRAEEALLAREVEDGGHLRLGVAGAVAQVSRPGRRPADLA